jgi:DNA-binding transcriptional ArsR family regulator
MPSYIPESLAIALGHHRRLRILVALLEGPGSATSLHRNQLSDLTVDDVDYHLKKLKSTGAVSLLSSQKVRGATKHTYELSEHWQPLVSEVAGFDPRKRSGMTARPRAGTSA